MKKQTTDVRDARRERRKKIRKRRLLIFFFVLLCIGTATFLVLLKTKLFPIKRISAKGSTVYTSEQIITASGITEETPIFSITESKIFKRLSKKLPYIETLRIKREFPDTVLIQVSDAKECYTFSKGGTYYSVSKNGKVLNKYNEIPQGLIEISAREVELAVGDSIVFKNAEDKEIFDFLTTYPAEKKIGVNSIDLTNLLHITLRVEDRFEVNLGNKSELKEKIDHLAGMISEIGDRKGRINLDIWSNSDSKGTFIAEN